MYNSKIRKGIETNCKKTQFLYEVYIIYEKLQKFTECSLESLHIICFEEKRKRLIYIIPSIMSTAFSFDWPKNVEVFLQIEYWLKNKLVHLVADLFSTTNHSIFFVSCLF